MTVELKFKTTIHIYSQNSLLITVLNLLILLVVHITYSCIVYDHTDTNI